MKLLLTLKHVINLNSQLPESAASQRLSCCCAELRLPVREFNSPLRAHARLHLLILVRPNEYNFILITFILHSYCIHMWIKITNNIINFEISRAVCRVKLFANFQPLHHRMFKKALKKQIIGFNSV